MLSFDQLNVLSDPIVDLFEKFAQVVINDIARRLAKMAYSSAAWQIQRLNEAGMLYQFTLDELVKLTGKTEPVLRRIFMDAGVSTLKFDDAIYQAAGLNPLPLNLSPAMVDVLKIGLQKTDGHMRNLTQTTAMSAQNVFEDAADMAYMEITTGTFDYNSAIKQAVKQVANGGLSVINYSGKKDKVDVAMRRAVLTGVTQTAGELQLARAKEMGADLVQTSAHIGARPDHELWQGKVFSLTGTGYPDFFESTGYGTITGLHGINCRHSFYPYFDGLSKRMYDEDTLKDYADQKAVYNGREMTVYEASQIQRKIERKIRATKREAAALETVGLDNWEELAKVRDLQAQMRDFIKQTDLNRQYVRE
jgi:hypothetical protein